MGNIRIILAKDFHRKPQDLHFGNICASMRQVAILIVVD